MLKKINQIKNEYLSLEKKLANPNLISNPEELKKISQKYNDLKPIIELGQKLENIEKKIEETKVLLNNKELKELAQEDLKKLEKEKEKIEKELKFSLLPPDPNDNKNIIMEIRAGTGGEEAALFAADLFKMYTRYAEKNNWQLEVFNSNRSEVGGYKEIIFGLAGKDVYRKLKYESGVHRVQRIPQTESSGRIHTSAATVAVLPEAEEIELEINPNDLRIDVFRSSGPGGQSVNTTDSAVRITHLPSGLVITCQDEKSQFKNKEKALKILRSRLLAQKEEEERKKRGLERRIQIGTGDRSEKIRTYNYPQNRVTDHRINYSSYNLESIMEGNLEEFIEKLREADQIKRLNKENEN